MENNKDDLQRLIVGIKNYAVFNGYVVTDENIADKLGISKEDLHAYESGKCAMPGGIIDALRSAYGIQSKPIEHITERTLNIPDDEDDDKKEESKV